MENNIQELITNLQLPPSSNNDLYRIIEILERQNTELCSSLVTQSYQSILSLERWVWELFSQTCYEWIDELHYIELCKILAIFNRNLIFYCEAIDANIKASLLIPEKIEWINQIFDHLNEIEDDNNSFFFVVCLWFDNLSNFLRENPEFESLTIISYTVRRIARNFIMTDQYKIYIQEIYQSLSSLIFTKKQLFYVKTCSNFLNAYLFAKAQDFTYTAEEIIRQLGTDYVQIILLHTNTIDAWSSELLGCITALILLFASCCWWGGEKGMQAKAILSTESLVCSYIDAFIRIVSYKQFYPSIRTCLANDQTILLDATLFSIMNIAQNQDFIWYLRSKESLPETLIALAETSVCNKVSLCVYGILGEILSSECLKELKISDSVSFLFFNMLEQAWYSPRKKYKQIPIYYLVKGFVNLSKIDAIQQKTAETNRVELLIEMSDQYAMVYDIIWALSFNQDIQQQLLSNSSFLTKLIHFPKHCDNEQIRKTIQGILWNLESNHEQRRKSVHNIADKFDIMISYSHKDEIICRRIYDELIKTGYRVWIDFDQMHGNVMDAMAQAIEQSNTILICMSEQYRQSNYCRAEAHYAFQRQLKIVPLLVQDHYQPDGWLLFLIGQLLYVDFTKCEFLQAMEMLIREVKAPIISNIGIASVCSKEESEKFLPMNCVAPQFSAIPMTSICSQSSATTTTAILPDNILNWTETHVQDWLISHSLFQMSQLFVCFNGPSLLRLNEIIEKIELQQAITLLHEDCTRRANQSLSLIEFVHFRSLMTQYKQSLSSIADSESKKTNSDKLKKKSFSYCQIL